MKLVLFRHWSLVATESLDRPHEPRESQLCAILQGGQPRFFQRIRKRLKVIINAALSPPDEDKLLVDGAEQASCGPEALQLAKVGIDKSDQLLTHVLSFMTKVDVNLCSMNEVSKRWTDDHETADTATPPKRRKIYRAFHKVSDSDVTDDKQSDSEAVNIVPKASKGDPATCTESAHSTRSASTSAAKANSVSVDTIMKSAGWTHESTFAKYYYKPVVAENNFGMELLKAVLSKMFVVA